MPHFRSRFAQNIIQKQAKLWPVVGIIGLRQAGKTTLMQHIFNIDTVVSLDDFNLREEANKSPTTFLEKLSDPAVIDEVQKAPNLFDAIKQSVDKKRVPGRYYITGSTSFSTKIGIRESLTGRIGIVELLPMTLAELHGKNFNKIKELANPINTHNHILRFKSAELARASTSGGMPFPAFLRDKEQQKLYWRSWLETTILRDLARLFDRGFDADFAFLILRQMAKVMRDGELPTLKYFKVGRSAHKIRQYLSAMQDIFLTRKFNCHPSGVGKEIWIFADSGLAAYLMEQTLGEGVSLSLIRHFIYTEIRAQAEYQGKEFIATYYKSAQGSPVDYVINDIPFKVVGSQSDISQRLQWLERPLHGAMKKLGADFGYLIAPVDQVVLPKKPGDIGILPWTAWS